MEAKLGADRPVRYEFDSFELDMQTLELRDPAGALIDVAPTAFELLAYLVEHRARVVSKDELFQALWPDVVVNENALSQCVWAARKAVGDAGKAQRLIKTVRGRGYRFIGDVREATVADRRSTPVGADQRVPTSSDRLVARESELARLTEMLAQCAAGEGRICLVEGEAGIGKTRLVQELLAEARRRDFLALEGRSYDDEGMPPFWPWKQVLRAYEKTVDLATLRESVGSDGPDLVKVVPDLRHCIQDIGTAPDRDIDEDRYCLFEAITQFLRRSSRRQPLIIALDDLHWADPVSLRLLKYIAPSIGRMRCAIVGTYRPNEMSEADSRVLASVTRQSFSTRWELVGLDGSAVEQLLRMAGKSVSPELAERVRAITGGNPLFVAQVARLLDTATAEDRDAGPESELPLEVREALSRRVQGLSPRAQKVLQVASVLGQTFRISDLRRVAAVEGSELIATLESLGKHWVVSDAAKQLGAYRFAHPLIRQTLYRSIPESERVTLHGAVARAIEQAYAEYPAARLDELAHHYHAAAPAGFAAEAIRYARLAAERAFAATAFEESARHYRRAVEITELLDKPLERTRAELMLGLAHALRGANEPVKDVRALFSDVANRAADMADAKLFADAALGYAGNGPLRLGPLTEMGIVDTLEVDLLRRAAGMLEEGDSEKKALVLAWLARALYHSSDVAERTRAAQEAVLMARRLRDPHLLARVLLHKQQITRTPHVLDERIADLTEAIDLTQRAGLRELQLDARHERAWALTEASRYEEAEEDIRVAARLADELRQPSERRPLEAWDIVHAYVRENVDEVEARDLARLATRRSARSTQAFGLRLLMARYLQGRASETLPLLENYAEEFPLPVSWRCGLASTYATVGRLDDARREFEALAVNDFAGIPLTHDWLSSYGLLANACRLLEDRPRARVLRGILLPFADKTGVIGLGNWISGSVAASLGDLETVLGETEAAESHYLQALDLAARLRAPVLTAWLQVRLAELIVEQKPRDALRARALLVQAAPVIDRLGLGFLRGRTDALRRRLSLAS